MGIWLAGVLTLAGCGGGPASPSPTGPAVVEFTGEVLEPYRDWNMRGVAGATVTLRGGQVDGWTAETDAEGRFAFAGYPACEQGSLECRYRRIRVEKAGYEAREESLDEPHFAVPGRTNYLRRGAWRRDLRKIPIGHAWPPDPQLERLRAEVATHDPVWLSLDERDTWGFGAGGSWLPGLMVVLAGPSLPDWGIKKAIAHEYCHLHQVWVVDPINYGGSQFLWQDTPEGQAFAAAEAADRAAGHRRVSSRESLLERAATVCQMFYYDHPRAFGGLAWLREAGPRQLAWARRGCRGGSCRCGGVKQYLCEVAGHGAPQEAGGKHGGP